MPRTKNVDIALYADDTALIAQSWRGYQTSRYLQEALDDLELWYESWRVKVNVTKSNAVLFSRRIKHDLIRTEPLDLFDEAIPWVSEAKYLGIIMDKKLTWKSHIDSVETRARNRMGLLRPLVNKRSSLSIRNGLTLYKTIILPIMTYASSVWAGPALNKIKKLQTVQNIALRQVSKSPWYVRNKDIHRQLELDTIRDIMLKQASNFYSSLDSNPNPLLKDLASYDGHEKTKYIRPKAILVPD